jgi:hypothetical protein
MNVSEQIIEVLNYLGRQLGMTIDWTAENVLPYVNTLCEKFITWEISTSWMWIGIMGALVILSLIASIVCDFDGMEWLIFAFVCMGAFIVICVQVYDIITCYVFPEKAIYDYIKELIQSGAYRQ